MTANSRYRSRALFAFIGVIVLVLMGLIIYPSVNLIVKSFSVDGRFTLTHYEQVFDDRFFTALKNSFTVASAGTIGATALGVFLAWLIARTDIPFKRLWRSLIIVPYLIPPFIGAIAWVYILGPAGYINQFWRDYSGQIKPLLTIYGERGVIFVMILYSYPIAYLITVGPLQQMNPVMEEASRISGAGVWRTLRSITLPLITPHIAASMLLIFMSLMANFGIPVVIGFPRRYFVLTNEIYQTVLDFGSRDNLRVAAAMSMTLVAIAVGVLVLRRLALSRGKYTIVGGKNEQPRLVHLGMAKAPAMAFILIMLLVSVVAPLLAVLAISITPAPGVTLTLDNVTLKHYDQLFYGIPKVRRAFSNSLTLAAGAATTTVLLAILIGYLSVRRRPMGTEIVNSIVVLPYAIPGTVVALAMILAFLKPLPLVNITLYNTIWIIFLAYVTRFLTLAVQPVSAGFAQIDATLEEAARISGASVVRSVRDVTIPLIRTSLFAGWFLVFVPALTELTLSALLFSVGNETLGQVVFGLHREGKTNLTAALAFCVATGVLTINILFARFTSATGRTQAPPA